jgi:hypothetical protein
MNKLGKSNQPFKVLMQLRNIGNEEKQMKMSTKSLVRKESYQSITHDLPEVEERLNILATK